MVMNIASEILKRIMFCSLKADGYWLKASLSKKLGSLPRSPPPQCLSVFLSRVLGRKQGRVARRGRLGGTLGGLRAQSALMRVCPPAQGGSPSHPDTPCPLRRADPELSSRNPGRHWGRTPHPPGASRATPLLALTVAS